MSRQGPRAAFAAGVTAVLMVLAGCSASRTIQIEGTSQAAAVQTVTESTSTPSPNPTAAQTPTVPPAATAAPTVVPTPSPEPTPEWAAPEWAPGSYTEEDLVFFILYVDEDLDARGIEYEIGPGQIIVGELYLGLSNLAGSTVGAPRDEWPTIIKRHFDVTLSGDVPTGPIPWEEAQPNLRIRMKGTEEPFLAQTVAFEIATDLWGTVVIDFPDRSKIVQTPTLDTWGVSAEEAYARAVENTLADLRLSGDFNREAIDLESGTVFFAGETFYGGSVVLAIQELVSEPTDYGIFITVPVGDLVIGHIIEDRSAGFVLQQMHQLAELYWLDGPGPASPEVYWWHDGEFLKVEIEFGENGLMSLPQTEIGALFDSLPS